MLFIDKLVSLFLEPNRYFGKVRMFNDKERNDRIIQTILLLLIGWALGACLPIAIFLIGMLPTCELLPITDPANPLDLSFACVEYDVAGSACTSVGVLLLPAILISMIVIRRRNEGEDLCSPQTGTFITISLGVISGFIAGFGMVLVTKMNTADNVAGGVVLLIFLVFAIFITMMCGLCYHQWQDEHDENHLF